MGCIARLGCLFLLAIAAIGGWYTRDLWLPEKYRSHAAVTANATWQPISQDGADRTRAALDKLSQPRGQVFQTLTASAVSYTHLRAHETPEHLVCRLLLEK